jgi:hypothetical protein
MEPFGTFCKPYQLVAKIKEEAQSWILARPKT